MKEKQLKRVLIMAGGTGGHVFPGLAVANYLRERNIEVHWLGTSKGLEARVVPEANLPLHRVDIGGVRGKGIRTLLAAPLRVAKAVRESMGILRTVQPDAVLGMGGFVSGPGGVAAWLSRRPLFIHEQNARAGVTNKILSHLAKKVLAGFPSAFQPHSKVIAVGNPVRPEMTTLAPPQDRLARSPSRFRLLIIGGSLGAQVFNEKVPQTMALLSVEARPEIWHQTGEKHFAEAKKNYESMGIDVKLQPFIEDMSAAYGWADMVLCRAGALTVAELCAVGIGAIFVPFPHAVDDHQTANAQFMVNNKAAISIQQNEFTVNWLVDIVKQYSNDPKTRLAMAQAAYQLRKTDVTKQIFDIISKEI